MTTASKGKDYRTHVGPPERYDLMGAIQFNLLTGLALREDHYLLDIGCGSLRAGRLFIPYLLPGHYFGIEPEEWAVQEGIRNELGEDAIRIKRPTFSYDSNFTLSVFGQTFDFIMAQSIFSHAYQSQIQRCLAEAKAVLKPTGVFIATYLAGSENYTGDEWVYPGCVKYTPDFMIELAQEAGLACQPFDWYHPGDQTWLLLHHPDYQVGVPSQTLDERVLDLEQRLQLCREHVDRLEHHPYVRVGLAIFRSGRRFLRRRNA
jgi:SAM-dependent methyltransferase